MRTSLCLAAVLLFTVASGSLPALADEGDPPAEFRSAQQRITALEQELQMARLQAASDRAWTQRLYAFVADCFRRLAEQEAVANPATHAYEASIASLEGDLQKAQDQLRAERARHTSDVRQLQGALQQAHEALERSRLEREEHRRVQALADTRASELCQEVERLVGALRSEQDRAAAESQDLQVQLVHARDHGEEALRQAALSKQQAEREVKKARVAHQEMERLRWNFARGAPADSVARVLTDIPAGHWRGEARSENEENARVALSVLAVLPDRHADTVEAVLSAARNHGALLDRATPALVRIGTPAVAALVAAGRPDDDRRGLNRGWVIHVLGQMGAEAQEALPWLEEVAAGEGREATQARSAIQKIALR